MKTASRPLRTAVGLTVAVSFALSFCVSPAFCQVDSESDGVTVNRHSDGTVDVYDDDDPAMQGGGGDGGGSTGVEGGGVRYVPGKSPYTHKYSDGTVVKRNPDGSIETSSPESTSSWGPSSGGGGSSASRTKRAPRKAQGQRQVSVRSSKPVVSKKAPSKGNVIIRRNADGSLDLK